MYKRQAEGNAGSVRASVQPAAPLVEGAEEGASADAFAATSAEVDWERFQGPEQLKLPATFNLESLKAAGLPGCSMLGSARALAHFFAALGAGTVLSPRTLGAAISRPSCPGTLDGERVGWGMGIQLGTAWNSAGRSTTVIGHRGTGGVVVMNLPEAELTVAVTLTKLSTTRAVTRQLVELALKECGKWRLSEEDGLL